MRALVVTTDPDVASASGVVASAEGLDVDACATGRSALERLAREKFEVVFLSLELPDESGLEVCRSLRQGGDWTPVVSMSPRPTEEAELLALESGADTHVVTPCSFVLLQARMRAVLRRATPRPQSMFNLGRWIIDPDSQVAIVAEGDSVELSPLETRLVVLLAERAGSVVARDHIVSVCWPRRGRPPARDPEVSDNALAAVTARLRRKLQGSGASIKTMRHRGLMLVVGEERATEEGGESVGTARAPRPLSSHPEGR